MTLWIISHLIIGCQHCLAQAVFRGMGKKLIKALILTQLSQRRSWTMKGPGQGLKSFDCYLKRAICTQEEKGQTIAPMNARRCQCQSWLVWARVTTIGKKQRLRLGSNTTSQDLKDYSVKYQLRLTALLLLVSTETNWSPKAFYIYGLLAQHHRKEWFCVTTIAGLKQ